MFTACHSLVENLIESNLYSRLEIREITKETVLKKSGPLNPRDLPKNYEIVDVLNSLKDRDLRYFIILLTISGRRSCDIQRMVWDSVKFSPKGNVCVILPFDKMHRNTAISFEFKFGDWDLPFSIEEFKIWVKNGIESGKGDVFPGFNQAKKQKLSRACKNFRVHSLRNRLAIKMLIQKVPEQKILSKIGWDSFQSLKRYLKVSASFLSEFDSYDEAVNFLLDEFA